ncbi:MAG: XapX domain-containing protein [Pseudomonadota bacterium]
MKLYLVSLAAGLLVGIVYGLINVRSPAPPVVALVGLFGILVGEQIVPVARHLWNGDGLAQTLGLADRADRVRAALPELPESRSASSVDTGTHEPPPKG